MERKSLVEQWSDVLSTGLLDGKPFDLSGDRVASVLWNITGTEVHDGFHDDGRPKLIRNHRDLPVSKDATMLEMLRMVEARGRLTVDMVNAVFMVALQCRAGPALVQWLLSAGADVNRRRSWQTPALAYTRRVDVCRLLLAGGANFGTYDVVSEMASAADPASLPVVGLLTATTDFDINQREPTADGGGTVLHALATEDDMGIRGIRFLLAAGADPTLVDAKDRTPLQVGLKSLRRLVREEGYWRVRDKEVGQHKTIVRLLARGVAWWRRRHLLIAIHCRRMDAPSVERPAAGVADPHPSSDDDNHSSHGDDLIDGDDAWDDSEEDGDVDAAAAAAADAAATAAAEAALADGSMPATYAAKFKLAKALHDSNRARFAALRAAPAVVRHETLIRPTIDDADGTVRFEVVEFVNRTRVAEWLAMWQPRPDIEELDDFFGDALDCAPFSWKELETFNKCMLPVMAKFELLREDVRRVKVATNAFVHNYRIIDGALTAMESDAASKPSTAAFVTERCAAIAAAAATAGASGVDAALAQADALAEEVQAVPTQLLEAFRLGATKAHLLLLLTRLRNAGVAELAFELLYQATVDGVTAADVMRKCKGQGPALVLARAAVGGWLYGGYMDCGVGDAGSLHAASDSFVFSLTNPQDDLPAAWSRCRAGSSHGVWHHSTLYSLCWLGRLHASAASVLQWRADDEDEDACYSKFSSHRGTAFTGSNQWEASEVLIFRV